MIIIWDFKFIKILKFLKNRNIKKTFSFEYRNYADLRNCSNLSYCRFYKFKLTLRIAFTNDIIIIFKLYTEIYFSILNIWIMIYEVIEEYSTKWRDRKCKWIQIFYCEYYFRRLYCYNTSNFSWFNSWCICIAYIENL